MVLLKQFIRLVDSLSYFTILLVVLGVVRPSESRAQAKVGELYVSVSVNEYVVRLDVPAGGCSTY